MINKIAYNPQISFKSATCILSEVIPRYKGMYNGSSGIRSSYPADDTNFDCFVKTLENDEENVVQILKRSDAFGVEEYKNLTEKEKELLRKATGPHFRDSRDIYDIIRFTAYKNNALVLGKAYEKKLDALYPEGYVFVSIGRSPSLIGKFLEFQGKDVKYCPMSGIGSGAIMFNGFSESFVKGYNKYLDSIGLTKEFVAKSHKPIVFTDFADTGRTLIRFEELLSHPEIAIVPNEKVHFRALNTNYYTNNKTELREGIFKREWEDGYPEEAMTHCIKSGMSYFNNYSPIPVLDYRYINNENFTPDMYQNKASKKMLFCIADYLEQEGKLA